MHAALSSDWSLASGLTLSAEQAAEWDARVLAHIAAFAARAWRGPLAAEERERLHGNEGDEATRAAKETKLQRLT